MTRFGYDNVLVQEEFLYPVAARLLTRCDAVLRIPGESKGADQGVRIARERGLPVFRSDRGNPCS